MNTTDTSHLFWTPGLKAKLKSKLVYDDPACEVFCKLKGLDTSLIPRAHVEDYVVADICQPDGSFIRAIVHRANVIWPPKERVPRVSKKQPAQQSKETAKLVKALKRFDPARLAQLLGQIDTSPPSETNIPY